MHLCTFTLLLPFFWSSTSSSPTAPSSASWATALCHANVKRSPFVPPFFSHISFLILILTLVPNFSSSSAPPSARYSSTGSTCALTSPFENSTLISVTPGTDAQLLKLNTLLLQLCDFLLINPEELHLNNSNIILVSATGLSIWITLVPSSTYTLLSRNFSHVLAHAPPQTSTYVPSHTPSQSNPTPFSNGIYEHRQQQRVDDTITFDTAFYQHYYTHDVLVQKWRNLSKQYDSITMQEIGRSLQNRPIHVLRLGNTPAARPRRLLINAMQHAREWITVPAVVYIIEQLAYHMAIADSTKNSSSSSPFSSADVSFSRTYAQLLDGVEVLVVPVVNPDGYQYSHTHNRLWRKNLRARTGDTKCLGVDLNRNWDIQFGGPHSTSVLPCSHIYTGPAAFSEPETAALRDLILETPGIVAHLDVHSFAQVILGPWAYTADTPPNVTTISRVGTALAEDMTLAYNTKYVLSLESQNPITYKSSGVMTDWTFSKGAISFVVELRPRMGDPLGFLLPESEISGVCVELFMGMLRLLRYVSNGTVPEGRSPDEVPDGVGGDKKDDGRTKGTGSFPVYGIVGIAIGGLVVLAAVLAAIVLPVIFRRRKRTSGGGDESKRNEVGTEERLIVDGSTA